MATGQRVERAVGSGWKRAAGTVSGTGGGRVGGTGGRAHGGRRRAVGGTGGVAGAVTAAEPVGGRWAANRWNGRHGVTVEPAAEARPERGRVTGGTGDVVCGTIRDL